MLRKKLIHPKLNIAISLFTLLIILTLVPPLTAQTPLTDLQLLAWSTDGLFFVGTRPGPIITLPNNSQQQLQILWQLTPNGSPQQELAQAINPQASPDGQFIIFTDPNTLTQRQLEVATGDIQPVSNTLTTRNITIAGDPAGQLTLSPNGHKRAIIVNQFFSATLWLGIDNNPAQPILTATGELFSDVSWHPDSNSLALIRTPLGNQTESASELWRVDLSTNATSQLSQNNVADRSPVWNAAGNHLAVLRNDTLTIVPADQLQIDISPSIPTEIPPPPISSQAITPLPPLSTIKVIHHVSNTCRTVPVGQIDEIVFEDYVKRVVPHEVYPTWHAEALKAQAVAARTYAWDKYIQNSGNSYHVTDWVDNQYMCDTTVPSTNQAVDATQGEYLAHTYNNSGQPITAMFSAENSSPTKNSPWVNYLQAVDDPVSFGITRNGHGYGLGQWGAQRWANDHGWSYQAILQHYYHNVLVQKSAAPTDTTPPKVTIVTPRHNQYLTSNKIHLTLNTADDSGNIAKTRVYATTPTTTTVLLDLNEAANTTGYIVDVSTWTDQSLLAQTLVLTAEVIDGSGKRAVSEPVIVGLDRVKPSGLLTGIPATEILVTELNLTSTLLSEQVSGLSETNIGQKHDIEASATFSFTISGTDDTAGLRHVAIGPNSWLWEGEALNHTTGQIISDTAALNGNAIYALPATDASGEWASNSLTLTAPKQYRAYFRLKTSDHALATEITRLEIINTVTDDLIGLNRIYGPEFRDNDVYQEFHVDFDYQTNNPIIMKLIFNDKTDIWLDRIILVEYPTSYTTTPTYTSADARLKIIDGAGNVSDDLVVATPPDDSSSQVFLPLIIHAPQRLDLD